MSSSRPSNNALAQLSSEYLSSGSSEDETVPGPRVSTKRRTPKDWQEESSNKKTKLPLPSALTSLFPISNEDLDDDPSQHDGRIRSFAHERGNWSTFVYIPYDSSTAFHALVGTIITECERVATLKPIEEHHVSLTRTVVLRHHWIGSFVDSIRDCLHGLHSFAVAFESVEIYCNEEKTRTFIALKIPDFYMPHDLVGLMDKSLAEFRLPPFYENPSFHLSVAWCVGDFKAELQTLLPVLQRVVFEQYCLAHPGLLNWCVDHLVCKSGNKRFIFPLNKK